MSSVLQREEGVSYIGLYDKGVECMRRNQVEEAISFFTEAIQHCPMFNYYGDRAKAYLSKGDSTSLLLSLRDCESVLSHHEILNARNAEIDLLGIHITAIKALLALHAPSIAEKYCKRAMESFAASVELQELEGEIEREKGEKEGGKEKKGSEEEEMEDEEEEELTRRREEEEDNLFSQISLPLLLQQNGSRLFGSYKSESFPQMSSFCLEDGTNSNSLPLAVPPSLWCLVFLPFSQTKRFCVE